MIPWLSASLLATTVLTCAECTFIILTSGRFWFGPALFFKTWLIYFGLTAAFLLMFNALFARSALMQRLTKTHRRRFFLNFAVAWTVDSALLVILVACDSYAGSEYLLLALNAAFIGLVTLIILRLTVASPKDIFKISVAWCLLLMLMVGGLEWAAERKLAAAVSRRSADFKGELPHVLLLVMDTVRSDHLSCYGYPFKTSPNLDRLAQEGVLCRNSYSASNWTPPGHISIFTGKYPAQHGNNGSVHMPDDLVSMTEILNRQGYYCIAMYNNPTAGRNMNLTQGFDLDLGVFSHSWILPAPFRVWYKLVWRGSGSRATFLAAEKIFTWIEEQGGHLFLYINVTEAHAPYQIHEPYFSQYAANLKISNPSRLQYLRRTHDLIIEDSSRFAGLSNDDLAWLRAAYDSEIAYTDDNLGYFAQNMRARGILDRILLVATSDHGEFLGEHATLGHPELLFNPVLQVPLILRYPDRIAPQIITDNVSTVDIFPTVLNLLNLQGQIPPDVQGYDLLGADLPADRALLCANISPEGGCYSLIKDGRKLIVNQDNFLPQYFPEDSLLFDLNSDPAELSNLLNASTVAVDDLGPFLSSWLNEISVRPDTPIRLDRDALVNLKALGYTR